MSALDRQLADAHAAACGVCSGLTDAREELRCLTDPVAGPAAIRANVARAQRAYARLGAAIGALDLSTLDTTTETPADG